jgi:hypothetical protein
MPLHRTIFEYFKLLIPSMTIADYIPLLYWSMVDFLVHLSRVYGSGDNHTKEDLHVGNPLFV